MPVPSLNFKSLEINQIDSPKSSLQIQNQSIWPIIQSQKSPFLILEQITNFKYPSQNKTESISLFEIPTYGFKIKKLESPKNLITIDDNQNLKYFRAIKDSLIQKKIEEPKKYSETNIKNESSLQILENFSTLHPVCNKISENKIIPEKEILESLEFQKIQPKSLESFDYIQNYDFNYINKKPKEIAVQTEPLETSKNSFIIESSPESKF